MMDIEWAMRELEKKADAEVDCHVPGHNTGLTQSGIRLLLAEAFALGERSMAEHAYKPADES